MPMQVIYIFNVVDQIQVMKSQFIGYWMGIRKAGVNINNMITSFLCQIFLYMQQNFHFTIICTHKLLYIFVRVCLAFMYSCITIDD